MSGETHTHNGCGPAPGPGHQSALQVELLQHLPFSVSSVAIGLTFAGVICFVSPIPLGSEPPPDGYHGEPLVPLFHLFHPLHMFFSAAATSAMFWRYDRRVGKAVVTGLIGAIGVCGISDIVMPQISLMIMGITCPWHICFIEHPGLVFPFAIVGVLTGLGAAESVENSTLFSHSLHVMSSTMASIFYLIAPFAELAWIDQLGKIFIFVIAAVMVPCCVSDIVFPLLMTREARVRALAAGHNH